MDKLTIEICQGCLHKYDCKDAFETNCIENDYKNYYEVDMSTPEYDD